jgi:hypothetical protein
MIALGCPGLVVCLFCVSGSGSSAVHVMFALFCRALGRFDKLVVKDLN